MAYPKSLVAMMVLCLSCTDPIVRFLDSADGGSPDGNVSDAQTDSGTLACEPGLGDCDTDPSNGCETILESSSEHCGACGIACASGTCENNRCRSGEWVDEWDCKDGLLQVLDLAIDDANRLFSAGRVPEACTPLGRPPLGQRDWGLVRYQAREGTREAMWTTRAGSSAHDDGKAVSVRGSRVVVAGNCHDGFTFGSTASPPLTNRAGCAVATDLNGNVASALFAHGTAADTIDAVLLTENEGLVVVGTTRSESLTAGDGCAPLPNEQSLNFDLFAAAYDATGACRWARRFDGDDDATPGSRVVTDADGNFFFAATFEGSIEIGSEVFSAQSKDAIIISLDDNGSPRWAETIAGPGDEEGTAVTFGDNLFVALTTTGSFDFGGTTYSAEDGSDAFVARLEAENGEPRWVTHITGDGFERINTLAYDSLRSELVAAGAYGDEVATENNQATGSGFDAMAFILDAETGQDQELTTLVGAGAQEIYAAVTDREGGVYLSGRFQLSTLFPNGEERVGPGSGQTSGFVLRWEPDR